MEKGARWLELGAKEGFKSSSHRNFLQKLTRN